MILVDTSVWIDHLRAGDERLAALLQDGRVLGHPFVLGEIALGNLRGRSRVIGALQELPQAVVASADEILHLIGVEPLFGQDIGYVDAHLVAAVRLTAGALLWTRDARLRRIARDLDLDWQGAP